jgi:hypothetical protein
MDIAGAIITFIQKNPVPVITGILIFLFLLTGTSKIIMRSSLIIICGMLIYFGYFNEGQIKVPEFNKKINNRRAIHFERIGEEGKKTLHNIMKEFR